MYYVDGAALVSELVPHLHIDRRFVGLDPFLVAPPEFECV